MLALLAVVSAFVSYERMEFNMKYGPIPAGSAVMEVRREVDGEYLATSEAVSNKFFSLFFPVDDRMESLMDVEGFPKRFEKVTREGRHRSHHKAVFLQDEGKIISDGDTLSVRGPVQDPLSIFYYLRLRPLKVDTTFSLYTFTDGKLYPLKVKVVGKERVRVKAGTFDCFVLVPSRTAGGLLKRGRMKVWLSDDERRLLVKMRSELAIGHISAELVRYEREE
ncbi:MAG: hypothetical protein DRP99_03170 [Candidatus Latescibacterota bacterium]|nr:MAG: hypothetical protein DRP99_03170 [Candidatus Latescibacterota bacterium]